jgi:hypothetical protein
MRMNTNQTEDSNVFTTYDLGVSAALLTAGYKLRGLNRSNNRRVLFVFEYKDGIEISANRFYTDELRVKARSYFDNLKALKSKLYAG